MNPLPTSNLAVAQKLWRYMDLPKFILLLTKKTLYFASFDQFEDPYEGFMPRSHAEAFAGIFAKPVADMERLRPHFEAQSPTQGLVLDALVAKLRQSLSYAESRKHFGVNCWHANSNESEAMWKLYSALGAGVAIESSVERLRDALEHEPGVNINRVVYEDFDTAQIEKGRSAYYGLSKRKAFEHEQEVRATVQVKTPGVGVEISCDLATLIAKIHISPRASDIFTEAVLSVCSLALGSLQIPVLRSRLFDPPDYDLGSVALTRGSER